MWPGGVVLTPFADFFGIGSGQEELFELLVRETVRLGPGGVGQTTSRVSVVERVEYTSRQEDRSNSTQKEDAESGGTEAAELWDNLSASWDRRAGWLIALGSSLPSNADISAAGLRPEHVSEAV